MGKKKKKISLKVTFPFFFQVATEIIASDSKNKSIEFFIRLAHECFLLRNFHALAGIIAGLNNSSIQSLKDKWSKIGQLSKEMFDHYEFLLSPSNNFESYRRIVCEFENTSLPYFPYIAVHMRDIITSQELVEDTVDLLNEILENGKKIFKILKAQSVKYQLSFDEEVYSYVKDAKYLSCDQLFELSNNNKKPEVKKNRFNGIIRRDSLQHIPVSNRSKKHSDSEHSADYLNGTSRDFLQKVKDSTELKKTFERKLIKNKNLHKWIFWKELSEISPQNLVENYEAVHKKLIELYNTYLLESEEEVKHFK